MRKALLHLKKSDQTLAAIMERVGPYKIQYREPVFETLVRSIVYQQLSGKAAATIFSRLAAAVGEPFTPQAVLKITPRRMQSLGLSRQKRDYIRDLAKQSAAGKIDFSQFPALDDETIIAQLTEVKGIGVWTVQMFLMFALQRPNVLPVADLGIRTAMKRAYSLEELPKPAEMHRIAKAWHPYCSVASWYLWRSLDNAAEM